MDGGLGILAKRVIATILLNENKVVQTRQFKITNVIGEAKTAIDFFNNWGADEIVILDISRKGRDPDFLKTIEGFGDKCFVPLSVGGWIRSLDNIRDALNAGADKVVINREAIQRPDFIIEAAEKYGSQCITVSIDYLGEPHIPSFEFPKRVMEFGAGEIYLTSISRDGMSKGYDLDIISKVVASIDIPVIASGGAGCWDHLHAALNAGADAVSIANRLHFSERSVYEAKKYLYGRGWPIRIDE